MPRPRTARSEVVRLLEAAPRPLYFLSEQRRIVFCNQALADWLGFGVEQLIGLRCDYHSQPHEDPLQRCAAGLCPPPEVFSGSPVRATVTGCTKTGQFAVRRADFVPLGGEPAECPGVVAVLSAHDLRLDAEEADGTDPLDGQLHQWVARLHRLQSARHHLNRLFGESPSMKRVRSQVELAGSSRPPVLIVGPPGSGREHVARTIHYSGEALSHAPLVPLSCPLLDAELLRTTVTAFVRQCAELETEQAAALLLLDVDQLAGEAQTELAGILTISELGLQPIATAHRRLLDLAAEGTYREDLAFALSTLVIELPGLSERREDIPLLAQAFVEEINAEGKQQRGGFTPEALDLLAAYGWPENVDELADVVRDSHRRAGGPLIAPGDLPRKIHLAADMAAHPPSPAQSIVLPDFLNRIEAELMERALTQSKGNKAQAARLLGISRARLLRRLTQLKSTVQADTDD
jgi:transcriptional regulator of acetoin/glycerol metabolism